MPGELDRLACPGGGEEEEESESESQSCHEPAFPSQPSVIFCPMQPRLCQEMCKPQLNMLRLGRRIDERTQPIKARINPITRSDTLSLSHCLLFSSLRSRTALGTKSVASLQTDRTPDRTETFELGLIQAPQRSGCGPAAGWCTEG